MTTVRQFTVPQPHSFGAGAIRGLRSVLERYGIERPLIVTDAGIRRCGILDIVVETGGLQADAVGVFDGVSSNPREEDVLAGIDCYRRFTADGLVALGGGSPIDAAKAIALLLRHEGTITEYDFARGGTERISRELPPLVAVPTTAGTGSEVSRGALIVTRRGEVQRKTIIASPRLVPRHAILDPELTLSLPPELTAGSGMDALSHAIEEFSSPLHHPTVAAIAIGALRRIAADLPRIWHEPQDLAARGEMLISAMMGGIGFEKGLGVVHSLSHAIGALHDIHHGLLNAVILPAALEFNRKHLAAGVAVEMARAAGVQAGTDQDAVDRLADWIRSLNESFGFPTRLGELGVSDGDRETIIARAIEDHCHRTNPRRCRPEDLDELCASLF